MHNARLFIITAALWCAACAAAYGQNAGAAALGAEEQRLVEGSRAAIIAAGLTPEFFDAHFRLEQVSTRPSDRRVVWRLKVGEHEAVVSDPVGSYTDEKGARRDTHSVAGLVAPARDLRATITRRRAERLMRACIGEFENAAVVYQQFGAPPRATLVLTAVEAPAPTTDAGATTATTSTTTKTAAPPAARQTEIRQGGRKRPPPRVGMIDLESGRCIVGVGQSGSPHPDAEEIIRRRP